MSKQEAKIHMMPQLRAMASELVSRAALQASLGKSFGGDRDLYTALGYPTSLTYSDFYQRFQRQDIAKKIINAPVSASWRLKPVIIDGSVSDDSTQISDFETEWNDLVTEKKLFHYFSRVDKLASIGQYAIMVLGFDDNKGLEEELETASELLYISLYSEDNAAIETWETDIQNPRYGFPKSYKISSPSNDRGTIQDSSVHHSRVIHVVIDPLEDDVLGVPVLEAVYNRLQDIELISGGSAEMFWQGAFPGLNFNLDSEADPTPQDMSDLEDEIEEYVHGFKRYLRTRGMQVEQLSAQLADPSGHMQIQIDLISAATGIPKRILLGSERGELSSSQDERAWNDRIDERRTEVCEPTILKAFIDKLISVGILTEPAEGYSVEWPDLQIPTEKDNAEVTRIRTEAITKYASSPGADMLVPPALYLKKYHDFNEDELAEVGESLREISELPEPLEKTV